MLKWSVLLAVSFMGKPIHYKWGNSLVSIRKLYLKSLQLQDCDSFVTKITRIGVVRNRTGLFITVLRPPCFSFFPHHLLSYPSDQVRRFLHQFCHNLWLPFADRVQERRGSEKCNRIYYLLQQFPAGTSQINHISWTVRKFIVGHYASLISGSWQGRKCQVI